MSRNLLAQKRLIHSSVNLSLSGFQLSMAFMCLRADLNIIWEPVSEYYPGSYLLHGHKGKLGDDSETQFAQMEEHFRSALARDPNSCETIVSWADLLSEKAMDATGTETEKLFALAYHKYEAAQRITSGDDRLLNNWARGLCRQAITKTGRERVSLFDQALEKYAAASHLNPDNGIVLLNWEMLLVNTQGQKRIRMLTRYSIQR
jgi:tetratricopeptide (TPR) repeat protein